MYENPVSHHDVCELGLPLPQRLDGPPRIAVVDGLEGGREEDVDAGAPNVQQEGVHRVHDRIVRGQEGIS